MTSIESKQLHSSQKEAMKKIAEFSGEPNDLDVNEWLSDLTSLFSVMKLKDDSKILETMGKLTGPALRWYQENLTSFTDWDNAEQGLRNRFKEFTPNSQLMREFFQIQQEENQSITSFYEHVIRKYKKVKKDITEQQVITVLQNSVKNALKEHLIRNEKSITRPDVWLQIAREEEHIQNQIQPSRNDFYPTTTTQPYFQSVLPTATIQPKLMNIQTSRQHTTAAHYNYPNQHQQSQKTVHHRPYQKQNYHQNTRPDRTTYSGNKMYQSNRCLICKKTNHTTSNCFYKKDKGCFKCGQSTHQIRNCPQQHFFE